MTSLLCEDGIVYKNSLSGWRWYDDSGIVGRALDSQVRELGFDTLAAMSYLGLRS